MPKGKKRLFVIVFIVALLFVGVGISIIVSVNTRDRALVLHEKRVAQVELIYQKNQVLLEKMKNPQTLKEREMMRSNAQKYSGEFATFLKNVANAKLIEARFRVQEDILRSAAALLKANKNDPLIPDYFKEARLLNDKNKIDIESLKEIPGNCRWNRRLHYLIGLLHYRSLVFLKKEARNEAGNLIDQSLRSFEKVFICVPHDRDTDVAIELLFKESQNRGGGDESNAARRLRLMPAPSDGGRGNSGTDREQGRY